MSDGEANRLIPGDDDEAAKVAPTGVSSAGALALARARDAKEKNGSGFEPNLQGLMPIQPTTQISAAMAAMGGKKTAAPPTKTAAAGHNFSSPQKKGSRAEASPKRHRSAQELRTPTRPSSSQSSSASMPCVCTHTKAQFREDCRLLPLLLSVQPPSGGRFVELGALDGLTGSNTYALERCLNWTGLLIEANPESYAKLQVSGRSAAKEHSAVCRRPGYVNVTKYGSVFAGMPEEMSATYIRSWGRRIPQRHNVVEVPCRSLTSLMQDNGLPSGAEFLSLDVQGAEELVLRAVDPAVFKVIMVEMDGFDKAKESRVHSLLITSGLKQSNTSFRVPYSRVYVRV